MIIQLDSNRLADRYVIAAYSLPKELRMRKPLEEKLAGRLASGKNLCIRGFWRIGKTELMRAAVAGACRAVGANGFFYDMRTNDNGSATPGSKEEALRNLGKVVKEFCDESAPGLSVNDDDPLGVLGSIDSQVFIGIDEMIALEKIGMGEMIGLIKSAPPNVRMALVCHRHRSVDPSFEKEIVGDLSFETVYVPLLSDDEHSFIIGAPAAEMGVSFTDGALGRLAAFTGNKPWEAFIFSHIVAEALEKVGGNKIDDDMVDEFLTLDALMNDYHGREVVENYGRMLLFAMTEDERALMNALAEGLPISGRKDAAESLERSGWVATNPNPMIAGKMFSDFIKAVLSGKINIRS